jgi:hypothetical protein
MHRFNCFKDEDIVRSAWRHAEGDRNDLPTPSKVYNKQFFINPSTPYQYNTAGSSGPEGAASSSIYLLQVPQLEMVDLMPIGRTELAKIADSVRFFISEYTVLAVSLLRLSTTAALDWAAQGGQTARWDE